jgi:hypothetical protein
MSGHAVTPETRTTTDLDPPARDTRITPGRAARELVPDDGGGGRRVTLASARTRHARWTQRALIAPRGNQSGDPPRARPDPAACSAGCAAEPDGTTAPGTTAPQRYSQAPRHPPRRSSRPRYSALNSPSWTTDTSKRPSTS